MNHTHQVTVGVDTVRKRYVSWDDDEADREWLGLTTLDGLVPGLAPRPLLRETEDGAPVIVMTRLPGETLGDQPLTEAQLSALVATLRRLFAAPVEPGLRERAFGPSEIVPLLQASLDPAHDLGGCQDAGLVRRALDAAAERLDTALGPILGTETTDAILAIGDGNLANVMWDGATCRLIDFEEFGDSDLAYELADVTEHASSRLARLLDVDRFVEAMELTADQQSRLHCYQELFAIFWLDMLLPGHRGFDRNPAGSTEDQARRVLDLLGG